MRSPYTEQLELYDAEELHEIAHIKRFLECISGDADFREKVKGGKISLEELGQERGCELTNLDTLRPVFDHEFAHFRQGATRDTWPLTAAWDKHYLSLINSLEYLKTTGDSDGEFREFDRWRQRQMVRTLLDVGPMARSIIHPPISFELSDGCSVGCWFCGISAKKFGGHFLLADGGETFWRETVRVAKSVLGRGMSTGFLYWATEPLDHPDYPRFLEIYQEETGVSPQTTTAIPLRNKDLTRKVLDHWKKSRFLPNRFSVLTTQILRRIHSEFTPEELLGVELVMQNTESLQPKQTAGRAAETEALPKKQRADKMQSGTIACVTGFLINMPRKTVRLVSPTMASATVPDGYYVFSEETFTTPEELAACMRRMVLHESSRVIDAHKPIKIESNYWFEEENGLVRLRQHNVGFGMELFSSLGPMLASGNYSPNEIIKQAIRDGQDPILTIRVMSELTSTGLIGDHLRPAEAA